MSCLQIYVLLKSFHFWSFFPKWKFFYHDSTQLLASLISWLITKWVERAYYTASQPGFLSSYHIDRRLGKIFKCFENIWLEKIFDPRCNSTVSTLKYFLSCWINIFSVHPRVHWDLVKSLSRRLVWWAVLQWRRVLMMELHLVLVWRKRLVNTALLPPLLSETDFISSQFQQIQMLICSWWKTSLYCKVYVGCASQTQLMKSKENIWTSTFVNHLFTVNSDSLLITINTVSSFIHCNVSSRFVFPVSDERHVRTQCFYFRHF